MQLELLCHMPNTNTGLPPILLIHGAFVGAWCWEDNFLPYFSQQGFPCYALSLRGHGNSEGWENLRFSSLADYVSDVVQVIEQDIKTLPILIGHSMGGMVVQKYLESHPAPAAVLMNSVPPTGLLGSSFYMACTDPLLFNQLSLAQNINMQFATPSLLKKAIFSENIPDEDIERYFQRIQPESQRVVIDMMGLNLPNYYKKPTQPMLVLGAEKDAFFAISMVRDTAAYYDADLHIFEDMAHGMMLERDGLKVADYIIDWAHNKVLTIHGEAMAV